MKKLVSLLLTLCLVLSFVGCGSKGPEILGTYETTVDLKKMLVEQMDAESGLGLSFDEYLDSCEVVLISEFKEDGTYRQSVDMDKFEVTYENLKAAMVVYMEDAFVQLLIDQVALYGVVVETKEELEAAAGMTFDEIILQSLGMDLATFIDTMMGESLLEEFKEVAMTEGKYKAENGKLHMSESLDTDYEEDAYEVYTIEGDVVTVTEGVNMENADFVEYFGYPMVMTKVSK